MGGMAGKLSMTLSSGLDFVGMGAFTSGGGPAGLPQTNLAGLWYASDYAASPRKSIKNTVNAATALSDNLRTISTFQNFDTSSYFTTVTKTYGAANGPTGATNSAMRIVGTGNCAFGPQDGWTAGQTYTIACDVKSNTGSSQSFKMGDIAGSPTTQTATTSWQRFAVTFVATGSSMAYAASPDGTTGWDLLVDNYAVFSGSSDLGRETLAGHMYLDERPQDTATTNPATGVVNFDNSGSGVVQFGSALSMNAFTLSAVVKRTSATDSGYMALLSDPSNYGTFTALLSNAALTANTFYAGNTGNQKNGPWYRNGSGWHVITHRYDGANYAIFVDGSKAFQIALVATAGSIRNFLAFTINGFGQFNSSSQMNSMALWTSSLSDSDVRTRVVPTLLAKLVADGQSYASGRVVCAEGDSIISNPASFYVTATLQSGDFGLNYGVSGNGLVNLISRARTVDALMPPGTAVKHVLGVLIGANELRTYAGATDSIAANAYLTDVLAYVAARRAAGWKVVICTILPMNNATHNARRAIFNTALRAATSSYDALCDFDTDAQMGIDNAYSAYPANWADDVHPNATGHARLMTIFSTAANTITSGGGGALLDGSEADGTNLISGAGNLDFSSGWNTLDTTLTANNALAPDGTTTAARVLEAATTARHILYHQPATITAGSSRTYSFYAKSITRRYLQISIQGTPGSSKIYAYFDLQTGLVTNSGVLNASGGTAVSSTSCQAAVNGFYKCTLVGIVDGTTTMPFVVPALSDVATYGAPLDVESPSFAGNAANGLYLWRPKVV